MVIMQHAYVEPTLMSIVLIMQVNRDLANSNLDFAGAWRCRCQFQGYFQEHESN